MITGTCIDKGDATEKQKAYLRPHHLLLHQNCPTRVADQSDPSLSQKSKDEVIQNAERGKGAQRNTNLSPGAASETSRFSSRVCHTSQYYCKEKGESLTMLAQVG
jgi:hypothetical protein